MLLLLFAELYETLIQPSGDTLSQERPLMSSRIATFIVSLITLSLVGIYMMVTHKNNQEHNETKISCKIVRDSFWDEKFDEKPNGFVYGPDGLLD